MVEGYPEMDDYEEAELVASGEIYVEDCEDPETVSRILHEQGFDDLALDYDNYYPDNPVYKRKKRYRNYSKRNRKNKKYDKHSSNRNSSTDTEDLLIGLGICLIPILIVAAIIYILFIL